METKLNDNEILDDYFRTAYSLGFCISMAKEALQGTIPKRQIMESGDIETIVENLDINPPRKIIIDSLTEDDIQIAYNSLLRWKSMAEDIAEDPNIDELSPKKIGILTSLLY